jgi:hypothetical protein
VHRPLCRPPCYAESPRGVLAESEFGGRVCRHNREASNDAGCQRRV